MNLTTPPPLPHEMGSYCQGCQSLAPTKYVVFFRHIGAVILMFNQHIKGRFCRSCVNKHFAQATLVTSFLGWWGMFSFFLTPIFLVNNVARYLFCLPLKSPAEQGTRGTIVAIVALLIAVGALSLLASLVVGVINH